MSAIFGFTFDIGRMTEVLTPDIYIELTGTVAAVSLPFRTVDFGIVFQVVVQIFPELFCTWSLANLPLTQAGMTMINTFCHCKEK